MRNEMIVSSFIYVSLWSAAIKTEGHNNIAVLRLG